LEYLEIRDDEQDWNEDVEYSQWLELLHPFVSVKDLVIHEHLVRLVAPALQAVGGEQVAEVLPTLQNLYLGGPRPSNAVQEAIVRFIVARHASDHPVNVYHHGELGGEYVRWEVID
jgi:hypothetical protein